MTKPPLAQQTTAPRRRGRPRGFDRDAALGLATKLFWQKGYEGTSVVDLTDAIGIEAPSLYAAFGSKKRLYTAALQYYGERFEGYVWDRFRAAATAREAVAAYLLDSASALTGSLADVPRGCMVTLSAADGEDQSELAQLLRTLRGTVLERLEARLQVAVANGELPATVDIASLARLAQAVQSGMSVLARDGAGREDLEAVARAAMLGWDGMTGRH